MALGRKAKTPEQLAVQEEQRQLAAQKQRADSIAIAHQAFLSTPAGRARAAYERDDQVFQYDHDVMSQNVVIIAKMGSKKSQRTADPVAILNSVCHEGWELVNGSFVFIQHGQQSIDRVMSSGQTTATKGKTVGYYLFKRCEPNRRQVGDPWNEPQPMEQP